MSENLSLVQKRRSVLQPENVVGVEMSNGTIYRVIAGSYTEEYDSDIEGPSGQVSFITNTPIAYNSPVRLALTYTHFVQCLFYQVPDDKLEEMSK